MHPAGCHIQPVQTHLINSSGIRSPPPPFPATGWSWWSGIVKVSTHTAGGRSDASSLGAHRKSTWIDIYLFIIYFPHIQSNPVGTGTTHLAFVHKYSLLINTEQMILNEWYRGGLSKQASHWMNDIHVPRVTQLDDENNTNWFISWRFLLAENINVVMLTVEAIDQSQSNENTGTDNILLTH